MGPVTGWLACLLAWLLGADPVLVGLAAVLYCGAWLAGAWRVLLLLAAPVVAMAGLVPAAPWEMAAAAGAAMLACVPLFWVLGRRLPWQGPLVAGLAVAVVLGGLWWMPWHPTFFSSDVATRAQIMVVALVLLLANGISRAAHGRRNRSPSSSTASTVRLWAR